MSGALMSSASIRAGNASCLMNTVNSNEVVMTHGLQRLTCLWLGRKVAAVLIIPYWCSCKWLPSSVGYLSRISFQMCLMSSHLLLTIYAPSCDHIFLFFPGPHCNVPAHVAFPVSAPFPVQNQTLDYKIFSVCMCFCICLAETIYCSGYQRMC